MTDIPTYNLVGAGGTGSAILPFLLRFLDTHHGEEAWRLQLIDGDHFKADNQDRQLFDGRYTDENKARALASMYAHANVVPVDEYIGSANIEELVEADDITLIAADNYTVRALLESHLLKLRDGAIINGGNEELDGSCQIFWRHKGKNQTPPLSHLHPEIKINPGEDRAEMDCLEASRLPGGGQTIVANLMSATTMLNALRLLLVYQATGSATDCLYELHFDLNTGRMKPADWRGVDGWR